MYLVIPFVSCLEVKEHIKNDPEICTVKSYVHEGWLKYVSQVPESLNIRAKAVIFDLS